MSYNKSEDRFRFLSSGSQERSSTTTSATTLADLVISQTGTEGLYKKTEQMEGIKIAKGAADVGDILEAKEELSMLNQKLMAEINIFKLVHPDANDDLKSDSSSSLGAGPS